MNWKNANPARFSTKLSAILVLSCSPPLLLSSSPPLLLSSPPPFRAIKARPPLPVRLPAPSEPQSRALPWLQKHMQKSIFPNAFENCPPPPDCGSTLKSPSTDLELRFRFGETCLKIELGAKTSFARAWKQACLQWIPELSHPFCPLRLLHPLRPPTVSHACSSMRPSQPLHPKYLLQPWHPSYRMHLLNC